MWEKSAQQLIDLLINWMRFKYDNFDTYSNNVKSQNAPIVHEINNFHEKT